MLTFRIMVLQSNLGHPTSQQQEQTANLDVSDWKRKWKTKQRSNLNTNKHWPHHPLQSVSHQLHCSARIPIQNCFQARPWVSLSFKIRVKHLVSSIHMFSPTKTSKNYRNLKSLSHQINLRVVMDQVWYKMQQVICSHSGVLKWWKNQVII